MSEGFDLAAANRKLQAIISASNLTQGTKRRLAQPIIAEADKEKSKIEADLTHLHITSALLREQIEAMQDLEPWLDKPPRLSLERNDCSRLHKLKEAAIRGHIIDGDKKGSTGVVDGAKHIVAIEHTFVVKHDWASAFSNAEDVIGEFCLPYNQCAFEFRLDGRTVILWAQELERQQSFTCFIEADQHWYCPSEDAAKDEFMKFLWDQVRAICIALDAEVATHTVVRAPHALNEKRAKSGKVPLLDYRVVDLARRHRIALPSNGSGGGKKRMHFRRGHWRHYETTKVWIRWCLVGNPDLGFIQKHYSL
jgi:hypothetical protein